MPAEACASRRDVEALVDGRLPERRARALEAHVRGCPACTAERAGLLALRERLRALSAEALPPEFAARLHRRLALAPGPRRRARWVPALSLPLAAAVCGFIAAAAVAQPLLRPHGHAGAAASAAAVQAASAREAGPLPIGQSAPSLFPINASTQEAGANAVVPRVSAAGPAAVAMTLLASAPDRVVRTLSDLVIGGGGQVVTTYLAHGGAASGTAASTSGAGGSNLQPVAAVDAVIPATSVPRYTQDASALGTVLAKVDDAPVEPGLSVRMIVTVLATPATLAAADAPSAQHARAGWELRLLLDAGRAAPYAAVACAVLLLGGGAARLLRRHS